MGENTIDDKVQILVLCHDARDSTKHISDFEHEKVTEHLGKLKGKKKLKKIKSTRYATREHLNEKYGGVINKAYHGASLPQRMLGIHTTSNGIDPVTLRKEEPDLEFELRPEHGEDMTLAMMLQIGRYLKHNDPNLNIIIYREQEKQHTVYEAL